MKKKSIIALLKVSVSSENSFFELYEKNDLSKLNITHHFKSEWIYDVSPISS